MTDEETLLQDPAYCKNGGKWHPDAVRVGDCGEGCCDDYECPDCGKSFRVEYPD